MAKLCYCSQDMQGTFDQKILMKAKSVKINQLGEIKLGFPLRLRGINSCEMDVPNTKCLPTAARDCLYRIGMDKDVCCTLASSLFINTQLKHGGGVYQPSGHLSKCLGFTFGGHQCPPASFVITNMNWLQC